MRNLFHFHCLRCTTKAALRPTFPSQGILLLFSHYSLLLVLCIGAKLPIEFITWVCHILHIYRQTYICTCRGMHTCVPGLHALDIKCITFCILHYETYMNIIFLSQLQKLRKGFDMISFICIFYVRYSTHLLIWGEVWLPLCPKKTRKYLLPSKNRSKI